MSDEKEKVGEYNEDGDLIPPRPDNIPADYVWKCMCGVCGWVPPDKKD